MANVVVEVVEVVSTMVFDQVYHRHCGRDQEIKFKIFLKKS